MAVIASRNQTRLYERFAASSNTPAREHGLALGMLIGVALSSLARNKTRTFLAVLGIVIGVGCVITMMGLAAGTRAAMIERVRRLGSNLLSIRPGEQRQGAVSLGVGSDQNLTLSDVRTVAQECDLVLRAAPRVSGRAQIKNGRRNTQSRVSGVTPAFFQIRNLPLATGRLFSAMEVDHRARVCVLGPVVYEALFGTAKAAGQQIRLQGQSFRVVGVLQPRTDFWDDDVWVPVTTAMHRLFGLDHVQGIDVQVVDEQSLNAAAAQLTALLRSRHRLRPEQPNDFRIRNQQDALDTAAETSRILTILLAGIASVSLLVGGIGIMNIMLVSVTERTREIGIRRAVGAQARDIKCQFLVEALVMCVIGGCLGIFLGCGACWLGADYAGWPVTITPVAVALPCVFAAGIGLFFGLYPAVRAARLSPLTALRYD
jgi:putative ABC transport system permease protein